MSGRLKSTATGYDAALGASPNPKRGRARNHEYESPQAAPYFDYFVSMQVGRPGLLSFISRRPGNLVALNSNVAVSADRLGSVAFAPTWPRIARACRWRTGITRGSRQTTRHEARMRDFCRSCMRPAPTLSCRLTITPTSDSRSGSRGLSRQRATESGVRRGCQWGARPTAFVNIGRTERPTRYARRPEADAHRLAYDWEFISVSGPGGLG